MAAMSHAILIAAAAVFLAGWLAKELAELDRGTANDRSAS